MNEAVQQFEEQPISLPWWSGPLLCLVGTLLALVAVELVVRVLAHRAGDTSWSDRPTLYFRHENAPTMQGPAFAAEKPAHTFRIAVVGDSFTFAPYMQFDDAFPARLERLLNLNTQQPQVEVLNLGVPRYSTTHEIATIKKAIAAKADLILLQVTLNDPEIKLDWPTELMPEVYNKAAPGSTGLLANWKTLELIRERLRNRRANQEYERYFFRLFEPQSNAFRKFKVALAEIQKLTAEANIPVVAVVFPLFGMTVGEQYPFFPIHQQVAQTLTEVGISSFDITERYRNIPVERMQVIPGFDRHPNEVAHRIATEGILAELTQRKLLPEAVVPRGTEPKRIGIIPESSK